MIFDGKMALFNTVLQYAELLHNVAMDTITSLAGSGTVVLSGTTCHPPILLFSKPYRDYLLVLTVSFVFIDVCY